MQDFGTKADNSPPPGGQLSAAEFNNLATENENAVLHSGQILSGASDTQMAQSLFLHGVKSESFQDSGAANAYVATPVSGTSGVLLPADYANMGGAVVSFKASAANSGASTLNIGQTTGTLLGAKAIRTQADAALPANAISAGQYINLVYVPAFNAGAGAWALLPWASVTNPVSALNAKMIITTASATATYTANSVTMNTAIGGAVYQVSTVSEVINLATTGAGGMDTGAAPASGYVAIYAIYNPTTASIDLLATNATAAAQPEVYGGANMPAGYTASALVSVWPTTAASLLAPGFQVDRLCTYDTGIQVLSTNAVAGATATLGVSQALPRNAKLANGFMFVNSTAGSAGQGVLQLFLNASTGVEYTGIIGAVSSVFGIQGQFALLPITAQQTIFYRSAGPATPLFKISISGYSF